MKTIKQEVHFDVGPQEVYEAYVDAKKHAEFTGSKVVFETPLRPAERGFEGFTQKVHPEGQAKVGGKFSAWDGELSGENLELIDGKKIVQKWRADDWPEGHYSTLTIKLFTEKSTKNANKSGTKLVLTQTDVPDDKYEDINSGWHEYYWEPMREYFKK